MKKPAKTPSAPFDDHGFIAACRQLHSSMDALDAYVARSIGISRNDLRCLNLLERHPMSPSAIARALDLTTGSVTTLLDRLEKLGLVERQPSPKDRRSLLIHLTEKSFVQIGPVYREFAEELIRFSESVSACDRRLIVSAFSKVANLCQAQVERAAFSP